VLSHGDPPGPGRHVFIAAIDRESGRCGPYLVHRPDRRIRRLVELMGESLEPAECPCRRGGNPLPPAPGGPLARWSRNSGYPLFQGDWRRPRGIVTAKVTSPGALGAPSRRRDYSSFFTHDPALDPLPYPPSGQVTIGMTRRLSPSSRTSASSLANVM